jgi:signal transduction histidine kinase
MRRDGPLQLRLVFLAVMLLLASTLGWLGWRLLAQDRELAKQRTVDRQEVAADMVIAAFEKRFSEAEQNLARLLTGDEDVHEDGPLFVRFSLNEIRTWPQHGLLYFPKLPQPPEPSASLFAVADELEFRKQDRPAAIAALRSFANGADPSVRAAALVRIARNQLHGGDHSDALKTYEQLSGLGAVVVGGMPAAYAASIGKLSVYEQRHDQPSAQATAQELQRDLDSGRWPIQAATYEYLCQETSRFVVEKEPLVSPAAAQAEGVDWLWQQWSEDPAKFAAGRRSIGGKSGSVVLVWRASRDGLAAFAVDTQYVEKQWLGAMKPQLDSRQVSLALTNANGGHASGQGAAGVRPAIRLSSATDLPWNVQIFSTTDADKEWRSRRNLLAAGISVLMALILTGGWFIGRTVSRELAVARLQSDFVSAVSHEFRTPLTALCQLSELLKRNRVASDEDRQQYYELLHNESHRLRRLVESLLDFGRLEAGKLQFRFEDLDASALVRQSAEEFASAQQAQGYRFELEMRAGHTVVHADRETLRCVLWNLFENAVKYSPGCETVWVELTKRNKQVEIAIRDRGVGVPPGERQRIFEKFVRGSAAQESRIRGTGIGLAMARQIVRAHGGDITVESEFGKGSTFRVLLPCVEV